MDKAHIEHFESLLQQKKELVAALQMALRVIPEGATYPGADVNDPEAEVEVHYELAQLLSRVALLSAALGKASALVEAK